MHPGLRGDRHSRCDMEREVMVQKNATPTEEQQIVIISAGLNPAYWTVIKELKYSMIICHKHTKEVRMIGK